MDDENNLEEDGNFKMLDDDLELDDLEGINDFGLDEEDPEKDS